MSPVPETKEGMEKELLPREARELIESPDAFSAISEDKKKILIEAAILFVSAFLLKEEKTDEKSEEAEKSEKTEGEIKTDTAEKAVSAEAVTEVKKEEINKKLVELKTKVVSEEPYLPKVEEKEKIGQGSVYYIGDSYMQGITNAANIPGGKKNVASGRPLLPKKEGKWAGGNDVESIALKVIRENKPKLLVINGGLNDFYMGLKNLKGVPDTEKVTYSSLATKISDSYKRIITEAKINGVKLIICDVPQIPLERANKKEINAGIKQANNSLKESGAQVLDTAAVMDYEFRSDDTHTTQAGYKKLSDEIGAKAV